MEFYSVSELAADLGITARTLRFYEDRGLIAPARAGGARVYRPRDRVRMVLILRGKRLGFSLVEIQHYLDLYDADPAHATQNQALLAAVRQRAQSLEEQRVLLDETLAELAEIARLCELALHTAAPAPHLVDA